MAVFSKVPVEERPSSIAPLIHVIACHEVLRGKFWNISAIFQLESRFNYLSKRYSVARSTWALIPDWACEIKSIHVGEIIDFRKFRIWDLVSCCVFLSPSLSLLKSFGKFSRVVTKSSLCLYFSLYFSLGLCFGFSISFLCCVSLGISFYASFSFNLGFLLSFFLDSSSFVNLSSFILRRWNLSQRKRPLLAVASVIRMSLRKFANISFPTQILRVNEWNGKICFQRRSVIHMGVKSLGRLPGSCEIFHLVSSWLCHLNFRSRWQLGET